jgi:hypothetical protein
VTDPRDTPEARAHRRRNIAIALGLVAFSLLIFLITMVRLGANVLDRTL